MITPVGYFSLKTGDTYPLYDLDMELADKREATGSEQVKLEKMLKSGLCVAKELFTFAVFEDACQALEDAQ